MGDKENTGAREKWFATAPRYIFRAVDRKYGMSKKTLCDVGCGNGLNLAHSAPGSYGIETDEEKARFARSVGLTVHLRDITKVAVDDLPLVDSVWCSAVLEHVNAPHTFLTKLRLLLKDKGMLALYVPTIPLIPALEALPAVGRYVSGYKRDGHVNAFVPATLRFACEAAGFRTVEVSPFYPGPLRLLDHVPLVGRLTGRCVYIGEKTGDGPRPRFTDERDDGR